MRYLVILDPHSVTGKCYASKGPDGTWFGQPCLVCTGLDNSHPMYMAVERTFVHSGATMEQRIHVPHQAVAFVIECEAEESTQIGFRAAA